MAIRVRQVLLLLIVVVTVLAVLAMFHLHSDNAEKAQVLSRYREFQSLLEAGQYESAYGLMTDGYRQKQPLGEFRIRFVSLASKEYRANENMGIKIHGNRAEICPASEKGWFGPRFLGTSYVLKKEHGEWFFTGDLGLHLD